MGQATPHIQSRQDRDRIRQRAASNRAIVDRVRSIIGMYRQGRAASACMDEVAKAVEDRHEPR